MKKTTLCFCIKENQVLLAMKKRGFGSGKWNGYGGKVEEGESPAIAAIRELYEESTLVVEEKDLEQVALIRFFFDEEFTFECFVYKVNLWQGEPVETEEMCPQWYSILKLPFDEMWAADRVWIPQILNGERIEAQVHFNTDGSVVKNYMYTNVEFI